MIWEEGWAEERVESGMDRQKKKNWRLL